jgi:hypothetical protein
MGSMKFATMSETTGTRTRTQERPWGRLVIGGLLPVLLAASTFLAPRAGARVLPARAPRITAALAAQPIYGISAGCCIQYLSAIELNKQLNDYATLGVQWIRFDFTWANIQQYGPTSYDWGRYETVVKAAEARGIQVLGVLAYTPAWARPSTCTTSIDCAPANASDYGSFAGAAAAHFAPLGVHAWEIWNEENISGFFKPAPNPVLYTAMLKSAYVNIKAADPSSTVVTGGTAPAADDGTNYSPFTFDLKLYRNGAHGYFDALGHHPYCFNGPFDCPKVFDSGNAWSQMQDTQPYNLVALMRYFGDGNKKIWGTEFGAPTNGGPTAVTEAHQASMITDSYALWKTYPWSGPLFVYTYRDPGTDPTNREDWFGLVHYDYSPKPAFYAYQASARGG